MKNPAVKPLLERWILLRAQIEERFENYWFNAALAAVVVALWWAFASLVVAFTDPFAFLVWIQGQDTLLVLAALATILAVIIFFVGKPEAARIRTVILFIAWVVFMSVLWGVYHPAAASADEASIGMLSLRLWRYHPALLGIWFCAVALHSLFFIIQRNQRAKLRMWWITVLSGFAALSLGYLVSPAIALLVALTSPHELLSRYLKAAAEQDVTRRGTRLIEARKAKHEYRKRLDAESRHDRTTIPFGNVDVPLRELATHLVAVGSAGSGKTLTLKLILQALLPEVTPCNGKRAVVFDPKHDAYSHIMGLDGISADICKLNPFQQGAMRYDLAADFVSFVHAQSLADTLIPQPKSRETGERFWRDAAVNCVTGIVLLFIINAPGQWRLGDIVRAFDNVDTLAALLASNPHTAFYLNSLGQGKTRSNVLASVCAEISKYRPIAATWEHAAGSVSIRDWMNGGQIWLLGSDHRAKTTMDCLNRLILTRLSQAILQEGEHREPRTFWIQDEMQSIHVETLNSVLTEGRSKGICFIGAFQSYQGMCERYGREVTDATLGQIRHKCYLRMSDEPTADWASKNLGEIEVDRSEANTTFETGLLGLLGWSKRSGGRRGIHRVPLVMPSELINLPQVNPATGRGVEGFYQGSLIHRHHTPWKELQQRLQPPDPYVLDDDPLPDRCQFLQPWTDLDKQRLGIADLDLPTGGDVRFPPYRNDDDDDF